LLRLVPAQRTAEDAAAAAELDRYEVVVGRGEPRAGETDQHAAIGDPAIELLARLARYGADVGEHHHRHVLLDNARQRLGRRSAFGQAHVGERPERATEVISRGEQRLRGIDRGAGDDADSAATPALVEQLHRTGGTLGDDLEPGDVVPDLDRQVE